MLILLSLLFTPLLPVTAQESDEEIYLPLVKSPSPGPAWLEHANDRRALAGLPPLAEVADWSNGCNLHSRYVTQTGELAHSEDPDSPWYTPEGNAAAAKSNLLAHSSPTKPDEYAIDLWLTAPFHALGILDARLARTGFGAYRDNEADMGYAACFDVLRGRETVPTGVAFPLFFPTQGSVMPFLSYTGGESPDPLAKCPGYTPATGAPLYLILGTGSLTPRVTAHSLSRGRTPLESCAYSEASYGTSGSEGAARWILGERDAVVLIPRQPLQPGANYTASITVDGRTYTWSFRTGPGLNYLSSDTETNLIPIME